MPLRPHLNNSNYNYSTSHSLSTQAIRRGVNGTSVILLDLHSWLDSYISMKRMNEIQNETTPTKQQQKHLYTVFKEHTLVSSQYHHLLPKKKIKQLLSSCCRTQAVWEGRKDFHRIIFHFSSGPNIQNESIKTHQKYICTFQGRYPQRATQRINHLFCEPLPMPEIREREERRFVRLLDLHFL